MVGNLKITSIMICTLYYPFRLIQVMAHFDQFKPATVVINTLFRTTPGMIIYLFITLMLYLGVSMGFYIVLSGHFEHFSTFGKTFYSVIAVDFQYMMGFYGSDSQ